MTGRNTVWRRAVVFTMAASMVLSSREALSQTTAGGSGAAAPKTCVPVPDTVERESSRYVDPTPTAVLQQAVERFRRSDPDAVFSFNDCEVSAFSTKPKPTVPTYAKPALRAAGALVGDRTPDLLPAPTIGPKPVRDLDGAGADQLLPLPGEVQAPSPTTPASGEGGDTPTGDPGTVRPREENRVLPAADPEPRRSSFTPPTPEQERVEATLVKPVLSAFLKQNEPVFRMRGAADNLVGLQQVDYDSGRFFRKATFTQSVDGQPLLDSKTIVLLDVNWNVVTISRTLFTPEKLTLARTPAVSQDEAERIARAAVAAVAPRTDAAFSVVETVLGIDSTRRVRAWQVRLATPEHLPSFSDFTVTVRADNGQVLNISDNVQEYSDAKTRRWAYTGGDLTSPVQVTSTGVYTSDDNTLRQDFFDLETDNRGSAAAVNCPEWGGAVSQWRPDAYGDNDNATNIRHTHRADRDFSLWSPADASGTFGESHTYYWSRAYFLWNRDALYELGVAGDARVTIIVNACLDDIGKAGSFEVAIEHDEGEENGKVRLADLCRSTNASCTPSEYDVSQSGDFWTCEGGGCYANPSVIHHELNHSVLSKFFGVGSSLDCGKSVQLKYLHEGLLGSVMPHAFWNYWNGVGFNPDTDKLFTSDATRGRVHADSGSGQVLSNFLCDDYDDGGQEPYEAGRLAGQPMWEIYHGKLVDGDVVSNTWRPNSDTDFQILSYLAADLVSASDYQDRYEYANRVMQILEQSNWHADSKATYCGIWAHHQLSKFILPAYCS